MHKFSFIRTLICASSFLFLFNSCDNEIDVIGEWKEIPIVYGVLNPLDTATYIRIEKAFLPPSTDAREVAQVADSLYFTADELVAKLYQNNTLFATLERVDGASEGYPRQDGVFASTPNILYKTNRALTAGTNYKLELTSSKTGEIYTATTQTINSGSIITTPGLAQRITWSNFNTISQRHVLNELKVGWTEPANADIYDVTFTFNYYEYEVDNQNTEIPNTRQLKNLKWKPILNYIPTGVVDQYMTGESFYKLIARSLSDVSGTNLKRCAANMDIRLDIGGAELASYIKSSGSNVGVLGGLFPVAPYTNIQNGYGVFSASTYIDRIGYIFHADVIRYLFEGEITRNLGFISSGC